MLCPGCGTENPAGKKFCSECGTGLTVACASCGAALENGVKFCGECGNAVGAPAERLQPAAERRLVSVLFADLVGFTRLSEARDAEEVRELLSRYFETCRRLIELYGGTVEKFIGDAVMAVWGAPTATEDDAERAVRAALDLVAAVSALGDEIGVPELRARAGVVTGEAAVTVGAQGQGMVAGDLVNTASRVQSAAEPGTVLVGDATRRATEQSVVYEDAGTHELKGKAEPAALARALRVVSGVRGTLKSHGLEAPFVGRDRELRQIKDLFHTCAESGRAHLVSVTGIAGIGKSRLAWEFYKYFDGLPQLTYWHRGRCLSYGEGVTYWALADMVRMRCRIGEEDEPGVALEKLRATLEEHVLDADERAFVEPRLAHLLALAEHAARDRQDLFAAWRLFFERLADTYPTVLAFEDLQWADSSLLDFIEYLLEWSRNSPLYVVTLSRPELLERRPTWCAGHRNFTSLYLEPLDGDAMEQLLDGLVPGLRTDAPPDPRTRRGRPALRRRDRADAGRPRADRRSGKQVPAGGRARRARRAGDAARADRRPARRAAAGRSGACFRTARSSARASRATRLRRWPRRTTQLDLLLGSLIPEEVLACRRTRARPSTGSTRSSRTSSAMTPTESLSKRERRARHLAAASHLERRLRGGRTRWRRLSPRTCSMPTWRRLTTSSRARAREALVRAEARAQALAASGEAQRYLMQAAELADDPLERAGLLYEAGHAARARPTSRPPSVSYGESVALYEAAGESHPAARVAARLADRRPLAGAVRRGDRHDRASLRSAQGRRTGRGSRDATTRLAGGYIFSGDDRAGRVVDRAIELGDSLGAAEAPGRRLRGARAARARGGRLARGDGVPARGTVIAEEHGALDQAATILVQPGRTSASTPTATRTRSATSNPRSRSAGVAGAAAPACDARRVDVLLHTLGALGRRPGDGRRDPHVPSDESANAESLKPVVEIDIAPPTCPRRAGF